MGADKVSVGLQVGVDEVGGASDVAGVAGQVGEQDTQLTRTTRGGGRMDTMYNKMLTSALHEYMELY